MKKAILTTLVLMSASISFGQAKATPELTKSLAVKTIAGYQKLLNSQELKTCWSQGEFKRLFTNSCTEFLELTESALEKMADSLARHGAETNKKTAPIKMENIEQNIVDIGEGIERSKILVLGTRVRLSSVFTISANLESMETGDAKEQVDVVVQRIREDIKEIKKEYLK